MIRKRTCRASRAFWGVFSLVSLSPALRLTGQDVGADQAFALAEAAAASAEVLISRGSWQVAEEILSEQALQCDVWGDASCRRLMSYSLGYLYQAWADADSGRRVQHLEEAAAQYELVLQQVPDHEETLLSLALVKHAQGADAFDEAFLDLVARSGSAYAGRISLLRGDALMDEDRPLDALRAYNSAVIRLPESTAARLRIAEIYRRGEPLDPTELMRLAGGWEARFPEVAVEAYAIVTELADSDRVGLAEDALLNWVRLRSRSGTLTPRRIAQLRETSTPVALADLEEFVLGNCRIGSGSWWLGDERRQDALGLAAIAVGRKRSLRGASREAEECWRGALSFAPAATNRDLDLRTELAFLYHRDPELDPTGASFRSLLIDLFEGKGAAIRSGDTKSRQRYHAALGTILAERGVWRSELGGAVGAIFQLESSLTVAHRRDESEGMYQPLPHLREMLAQGYDHTGNAARAASRYLDAARAYMDTDHLKGARSALAQLSELRVSARTATAAEALREFVEVRSSLSEAAQNGVTSSYCEDGGFSPALSGLLVSEVEQTFVLRQLYKMHGDCVAASEGRWEAIHAAWATHLASEPGVKLYGIEDALRLEQSRAALEPYVRVLRDVGVPDALSWIPEAQIQVGLGGERVPAAIHVSPQTRAAGRLVELAWNAPYERTQVLLFEPMYSPSSEWERRLGTLPLDLVVLTELPRRPRPIT